MDRLRVTFAALLVASVVLGGVTVADFGDRLRSVDAIGLVENRIGAELVDASLRENRFVATIRLRNPTNVDLRVQSAKLRVYNSTEKRIASGAGQRLDDGGSALPAGESVTLTYAIRLSPDQRAKLQSALRTEAFLATSIGLKQGDVAFSIGRDGMNVTRVVN